MLPTPNVDSMRGLQLSPITGHADTTTGTVRMQITLQTPVVTAWQALTAGEHTVSWLGRLDPSRITEGGRFDLWHDTDVRSRHTVLQWQHGRLLTLTWDFPEERPSRVTFALTEMTSSTVTLILQHEDLENSVAYAAGWHRHLQYLEAHLEGHDLSTDEFWTGYEDLVEYYERGS